MSGLVKGGTYHARLVARNDDGLSLGADVDLHAGAGLIPAANAAPLPGSTAAGGPSGQADPDTDPDAGSAPVLAPPAPPELGQTLGVAAQAGSVLVRLPGSTRAVALTDAASIPVGSIARRAQGHRHAELGAARRAAARPAPSTAASSRSASPPAPAA